MQSILNIYKECADLLASKGEVPPTCDPIKVTHANKCVSRALEWIGLQTWDSKNE